MSGLLEREIPLFFLRTLVRPGITGWMLIGISAGTSIIGASSRRFFSAANCT